MIYQRWCKSGIKVTEIIFLCALMAGCGYTTRSMIADKYRTIYITPFENKIDVTQEAYAANKYRIYRPTLETDITRSVNNKFLTDGNLKPIQEESADLILKGELVEFRRDPLRYTESDEVEEYRINIVVNLILYDRKENAELWRENNFTGDATYFTTGSLAKSEDTAASDALSDLARRIVERTVEQW
ncbi:MAG: LPS assembly lipoprotein LptE [Candidatus Omnitrophota bacterium]